ncbi:Signal transduction histidine kinase [Tistlia consotensis]|uniref:histidine kinase n=1 Tax=Tistlia consotensis USBA 355 TaxID=560819 RepID=A0A1Y6BU58_9PROT|nr:ATP-binding protein [Tistlia consotensis]SMF21564.1 Signal transduction histidine kinase [Tistlia consotensis USBA 355]SNR46796.1 Signal transduction histidine kinase [Tistlia consotensis]
MSSTRDEALRSVADWYWRSGRDGLIEEIGPTVARSLGLPAQLLVGRPFGSLIADPAGELARQFERLTEAQQPFRELPLTLLAQDGAKVSMRLSGVPQYDAGGRFAGYAGTGTEVARPSPLVDDGESSAAILAAEVEKLVMENVRLRIALGSGGKAGRGRAAEEHEPAAAQRLDDERRNARLAHELRTPLNAIIGYAEFASGRVTSGEDKVRECLERILTAARHMDAFIGAGFEPSETPRLELAPVALDSALRDVAAMVEPQARAKAIDLSALSIEGAYVVLADRGALTQVLVNLAVNAIKYNRRGGAVGASVSLEGVDRVALAIWDTGKGIAPDDLPHIFEPGFRGKGPTEVESEPDAAGRPGGRGLGLAISADLARAMGGRLDATSELGQGTRVTLRLRRAAARPE